MKFIVNDEKMRITSDGLVGIGTTAPATKLQLTSDPGPTLTLDTFPATKLQLTSDPGPTLTLDTFGNTAGELIGAINFNNRTSAPSDEVLAYVKAELTSSRRKASLQLGTGSSGPATTKLYIDSEGKVGIGTTSPQAALDINAAASTSPFIASINSSEKARIDSSGRLLVGTSSSINTLVEAGLQVQGTGADAYASFGRWSPNAANPGIVFNKSRGTSVGTRAIVQNDDNLGEINFTGDDGSAFIAAARIQCQVDGTPAGPTPGPASMPGRLVFSTTASGATTLSPRMTIDSDGNVGIGTGSPSDTLHVAGGARFGANDTSTAFLEVGAGATGNRSAFIDLTGDTTYSDFGLRVSRGNSGANTNSEVRHRGTGSLILNAADAGSVSFSVNGSERARIASNGNVGIGTSIPSTLLEVNGSFSKGSGSFKIDHPLPALTKTHHLVHSFVEAPDASNLYAGMVQLSNGVAVVNIDTAHRMTEGTFEALNDPQSWSSSNESGYAPVKSSLSGNLLTIECQDQTSSDTVYYEVRGIRKDQHMIETEWTDESGRVITEPLKQVLADAGQ
jgi:hypothetical protein